ncbi:DAN domain family member 5 [Nothobranchius furzeri]|uniref:DAN domain family member 5-like n=2 Tax=Nothobranchius furzeri TaxID=105023 RepID=A0A9D3BMB5_NOTFU|nr:DAN domain family member 5-like [Nothobranchius furzeri]
MMAFFGSLIFLLSCISVTATLSFRSLVKKSGDVLESSGAGPDGPLQGVVKVLQLDPHALAQSGFLRRGLANRRALTRVSRLPFPSFLSQGRPGQPPAPRGPASPPLSLRPRGRVETELKKMQGRQMWQGVLNKGDKTSLPVNLKDAKQTCTAVPFTQRVTADGCQTVTVRNRLCFGQCSSLFVPSEAEFAELIPVVGAFRRRGPCSRCAPSKSQTVTVPLLCGAHVRQKRVMVVEECKCETGREERSMEAAASSHL